jgi:uncharacterized protein GlcG (DUF336 family)
MIRRLYLRRAAVVAMALAFTVGVASAAKPGDDDDQGGNSKPCGGLPDQAALKAALDAANAADASGLKNQMWATIVDRDGVVCAVAFTGVTRGAQWPGSRVISAQKANTANAFSLDSSSSSSGRGQPAGLALSTANLYAAVQPGGSLFGLQHSNPVEPTVGYKGPSSKYGTESDPMVGEKIGGVNVFGGGLALYATGHVIVGGVGVSGDTSCRDHNVAYNLRHNLMLDHMAISGAVPAVAGPASLFAGDATHPDNIIFDLTPFADGHADSNSPSGFGHPSCLGSIAPTGLPAVVP